MTMTTPLTLVIRLLERVNIIPFILAVDLRIFSKKKTTAAIF